ncbi:hypothetical protein PV342_39695 [Streptomyces sp. PA03-3a]|nr:hypothetical protein [Streptomyces sp. PA03-3a]
MNNQTPPLGEDELPEIDEVLATALAAQGEPGERALGLLRDARRILSGAAGLLQAGEVAEASVRSAADALLGLTSADDEEDKGKVRKTGLQAAAWRLVKGVEACDRQMRRGAGHRHGAEPAAAGGGEPGQAPGAVVEAAEWEEVRQAAVVVRGELTHPGGYHRRRAQGIAERLMGVVLGSLQEQALDVWGAVYGKASGTLHGGATGPERAAALYHQVLDAARELLVPLPGRAARVLELAALTAPSGPDARELAGWADPRATTFFFTSRPVPPWLPVLQEHAPHLLLADEAAGGHWPAAPFLEHLAVADPDAARAWLTDHTGQLAAAGPAAVDALLRLALAGALGPDQMRLLLPYVTAPLRSGLGAGWTRRLAARWARTLPAARRDGDWLLVAEHLLKDAVDTEHAGRLARQAVAERVHAASETADDEEGELQAAIARESAGRLPDHEVASLLRELVATAHPVGGPAYRWARPLRNALAGLLRRDVEATAGAARHLVFGVDLDEVRVADAAAFGGPRLARAVLDLAAADAAAGVPLAERTRAWARIVGLDGRLHGRLLASHLAAHSPAATEADHPADDTAAEAGVAGGAGEWWDGAVRLTGQLLADGPSPEGARLAALVFRDCPPALAEDLRQQARAELGTPPSAREVDQVLAADTAPADGVDGTAEPLASWLRVWDWSPVLPAAVLVGFEPLLAALRRVQPEGPADPRAVVGLLPLRQHTVSLDEEYLDSLADDLGPLVAAAALAAADDVGADGYAMVLHRLVAADPAAWTADVPAVLKALKRPELGAFFLAAAAAQAHRPTAFPAGTASAAVAAFALRRALPAPAGGRPPATAVFFADQAMFDLLAHTWRTGTNLPGDQEEDVLAHLHALAAPLIHPTAPVPAVQAKNVVPQEAVSEDAPDGPAVAEADDHRDVPAQTLPGSHPAVRALGCLLEYAAYRARTTRQMPDGILDLTQGALAAHGGQDAVATAVGVHLPSLHHHAPRFTATAGLYRLTPSRPSPAASWLRWGPVDLSLLAALDRAELLRALREGASGVDGHLAHALLTDSGFLGDPMAAWTDVAASAVGAAAASRLLETIAALTPRPAPDGGVPASAGLVVAAATLLWRAALAADLPPGALAGAGAFTTSAVEDTVWLVLTRASADHTPALIGASLIAERAAAHPSSPNALLLAAKLVAHPAGAWPDEGIRRHARALLQAAAALPADERPAETEVLREALVNAGEIDAIQA